MTARRFHVGALTRRLRRDERGATLILVALAILPLTIAVGVSIDYARAARLQTKINAIADAASLAAVTTPMMAQRSSDACDAARRLFVSQAAGLPDLTLNDAGSDLAVSVTDNASTTACATTRSAITEAYQRTSSVTWNGRVKNLFGGLLGVPSLAIGGTSRANAAVAPTMDFYLLLDTSGSMSFPSTSAGITKMRQVANGCAFACHSTNDATAKTKDGATASYYDVAISYGIPLRIDDAKVAIGKLMTMVADVAQKNDTSYRAALATFAAKDQRATNFFRMRQSLTDTLPDVATAARSATTSLYYKNGWPTKDFSNNDTDTATDDAFSRMNENMATPGNGSKNSSDRPQAVMFLITDGMRDETRSNGKPEIAINTAWCTTIKNRGIRIGILYTEYLKSSMDGDSWSQQNVVPYLYTVEPALKSCASDNLYYKVTTDDDISTGLEKLFRQAVATARIIQ
jgi:Flp pilus assembly protein TadG